MQNDPLKADNVSDIENKRLPALALPATVNDLIEQKTTGARKTLNDMVDDLHIHLWSSEQYRNYLDAVHSSQAQEGDLFVDDIEAARMIRERALKEGQHYVAKQNLATIRKALLVVMRRYKISRRERRQD